MPYPLSFYLLDMFMFNAFSVCHSLCQSVTGIALFIFWLIPYTLKLFVFNTVFELDVVFVNYKLFLWHNTVHLMNFSCFLFSYFVCASLSFFVNYFVPMGSFSVL